MVIMERYNSLRAEFLGQSSLRLEDLEEAKNLYKEDIDSPRTFDYINDWTTLVSVLEKRDVLSCEKTEPLKNFTSDSDFLNKIKEYDNQYLSSSSNYSSTNCQSRVEAQRGISDSVAVDDTMRIHGKMHNKQSQTPGSSRGFDKQFDVEFQRKVFLKISELCGKSWREIARRLNIREGDIDSIESKHHLDLQEKCYEVLNKFVKEDDYQWEERLKKALEAARRRDIKEEVDKLIARRQ